MTNLYLVTREDTGKHDTYQSMVVAAMSREDAAKIHPQGKDGWDSGVWNSWVSSPDKVHVECIGITGYFDPGTVIHTSFLAA